MARELVDLAHQLIAGDASLPVALDELHAASRGRRFDLEAAYAIAVRDGRGSVTPTAELLELVRYETEGPLRARLLDPDHPLGRWVPRPSYGPVHRGIVLLVVVGSLARLLDVPLWLVAGELALLAVLYAALKRVGSRRGNWLVEPAEDDRPGRVPVLAQAVARYVLELDDHAPDLEAIERVEKLARGGEDRALAHRRARYVLRQALGIIDGAPISGRVQRRARTILRAATREA